MFGLTAYAAAPYAAVGGSKLQVVVDDAAQGRDFPEGFLELDGVLREFVEAQDAVSTRTDFVRAISEAARGAASVQTSIAVGASFDDGAFVFEAIDGPRSFFRLFSDIVVGADSFETSGFLRAFTTDTTRGADAPNAVYAAQVSFSSTARGSDAFIGLPTYSTQVQEAASSADSDAAAANLTSVVPDTASASVGIPTNADLHITAQDFAQASVLWPTNVHVYASVNLAVRGADSKFIGRFLWELIDDTQTANWYSAVTSQNPGWVMLQTEQGVVWQLLTTAQAGGWQLIDTEQTPSWGTINNI